MRFKPRLGPAIWLVFVLFLALIAADAAVLRTLFIRPLGAASVIGGLGLATSGLLLGLLGCWIYARLGLSYDIDRNRLEIRGPAARHIVPIGDIQDIVSLASMPLVQEFQGFRRLGFLIGCGQIDGIGHVWCCATRSAEDFCYIITRQETFLISPAGSSELRNAYEARLPLGTTQSVQRQIVRPRMPEVSVLRDRGSLGLVIAGLWLNILLFAHVATHAAGSSEIVRVASPMWQLPLVGLLVWMLNGVLGALLHRRQRPVAYLLFIAALLVGVMLLRVAFDAMPAAAKTMLAHRLFAGISLSGIVAMVGYRRRALSESGALGALVVGMIVFGYGGWVWGSLLIGFFLTSSAFSRYRLEDKQVVASDFSKGSQRDLGQVMANGGVGAALAILNHYWPSNVWLPIYVGVMSAVTADTWATEIGVLSKQLPRSIKTWKKVPAGTSGAISLRGSAASLLGALFIGALAVILLAIDGLARRAALMPAILWLPFVAMAGGAMGSLVDSLLGATLQGIYRCDRCDKDTERRVHRCGDATSHVRGWAWLSNDWVNLISSIIGGAGAFLVARAVM